MVLAIVVSGEPMLVQARPLYSFFTLSLLDISRPTR